MVSVGLFLQYMVGGSRIVLCLVQNYCSFSEVGEAVITLSQNQKNIVKDCFHGAFHYESYDIAGKIKSSHYTTQY